MPYATPIPTSYGGCRFRSRLEARWAVFFDTLELQWEYEPELYKTSSGVYLPDFRLRIPQIKANDHYQWFEVKPEGAPVDPRHAAMTVDAPLIVARGLPRDYADQAQSANANPRKGPSLLVYGVSESGDPEVWRAAFCDSTSPGGHMYCGLGDNRHWCMEELADTCRDDLCHLALVGPHPYCEDEDGTWTSWPPDVGYDIDLAYRMARSARFDATDAALFCPRCKRTY